MFGVFIRVKILGVVIALSSLLVPSIARAEWVHIASEQNSDILIEDSSVRVQGDKVEFWQQDVLVKPFRGVAKRFISHYVADCSNGTRTTIKAIPYNRAGRPIADTSLVTQPGTITQVNTPGTVGYAVQNAVCAN